MHRKMFPFLEYQDEEIDVECYKCESLSDSYRVGLEKIEEFFISKENKFMMKDLLTEEDKQQIKKKSIDNYNLLWKKLNLEEIMILRLILNLMKVK